MYNYTMSKIYLSKQAYPAFVQYLKQAGHDVIFCGPYEHVEVAIQCHPDLLHCSLGPGMTVFHGETTELGSPYPKDVLYNGCSTGKYFIHNLKYTHPVLRKKAEEMGLELIHVPQGYSRCLCLPVATDAVITSDQGMAKPCRLAGLKVLEIQPKHVLLPGYPYGFLGGAAGRIGDTIHFHGTLSTHPDSQRIKTFIAEAGFTWVDASTWHPEAELPLMDIGSIIEEI